MTQISKKQQKYVVAVSGGVDSVALLDMLVSVGDDNRLILDIVDPKKQLIVAHFDHGIRLDSREDERFVAGLARKYRLKYASRREELGENASEDTARRRRYAFLREIAENYDAKIITAHHANDVVESVAINLIRGTGWRGLAAMSGDVERPLIKRTKSELVAYAHDHSLTWREDSTNKNTTYLRNRIRQKVLDLPQDSFWYTLALRDEQALLGREIDLEVARLVESAQRSRYFYTHIDITVALECLRREVGGRLTRPQLERLLVAVKTFHTGKTYEAGAGIKVTFSKRDFAVHFGPSV